MNTIRRRIILMHQARRRSGPKGGDAQKLCDAFNVKAVARVEKILRKPAHDERGYIFEIERHEALVEALRIASFGVGLNFENISYELPEEFDGDDLVICSELPASLPNADTQKAVPGYYQVNMRAQNPDTPLKKPISSAWMPALWANLECAEKDLSENCRRAMAAYREKFLQLGSSVVGFKKLTRVLNPNHRDDGGINFLDASRRHFGQIIFGRYLTARKVEQDRVVFAFTAAFQYEVLSRTNNVNDPFDPLPRQTVIRMQTNEVGEVHQRFLEELKRRPEQPRYFRDLESLQSWFDANAMETLEVRVRQGVFVRMRDYEVAIARRKVASGQLERERES